MTAQFAWCWFVVASSLVLPPALAHATEESDEPSGGERIRVGAYVPYAFQPGVRGAYHRDLLTHARGESTGSRKSGGSLFVGPALALFGRPGNHISTSISGECGYRLITPRRERFHEFTLEAGYLAEWQVTRVTVNLGNGNVNNRRDLRNYFLGTMGYTVGRQVGTKLGWYLGARYGFAVSPEVDASTFFSLETGIQFGRQTP